ncbi:MAG: hypothetical protein HZA49_10290 [Planctomycetes bacterium]|nr:hypothetical protein [Planctomycetota bacterium]
MKCNKDYDLVGFLNNEGTKEERAEITGHIGKCSDCLRELADIRAALRSLKDVPQIEPAPDFTSRVLKAVKGAAQVPVRSDAPAQSETMLDILKYYLRRSPPWAFSTALHAVILALLAFVFVSQSYRKPMPPENVIHWTQVLLPKAETSSEPVRTVDVASETASAVDITIDRAALVAKLRAGDDKVMTNLINRSDKTRREELLTKYNGKGTEQAVADGMKWLAAHQEPAGNWTPSKYNGRDESSPCAQGRDEYTVALTGLATLGYTGQGNSHLSGEYSGTVDKSVKYLISVQQPNGLIDSVGQARVPASVLYNHGIATYALLEDYLIAQDYAEKTQGPDLLSEILEDSVTKAISFIIKTQSANGGWGYAKGGTPDTSVTVWQIQVLRLASVLDMQGVEEALRKSRQWLNEMTNDDGLVGFQARMDYPNGPDGLTAAGLNAWLMIQSVPGMGNADDAIAQRMDGLKAKQVAHLRTNEPMGLLRIEEDGGYRTETYLNYDLYYWYWAGPDLMGSPEWDNPPDRRKGFGWNESLKRSVLMSQAKDGRWKVDDQWSVYGGEIYTTSVAVLTLQVYYRNPALRAN